MRVWLCIILLAGCTAPVDDAEDTPGIAAGPHQASAVFAVQGCPLTLPDGSPMPCDEPGWSELEPLPDATDGWRCTEHFNDDWGNSMEVWTHVGGGLGAWVQAHPWKDGGTAFYMAQMFLPDGGWNERALYAPDGFLRLPDAALEADGDLYMYYYELRLFERGAGGDWHLEGNATLLSGSSEGHPRFVWKVPIHNGTFYIDVMEPQDDDSRHEWRIGEKHVVAPDGTEYVAGYLGSGVKYEGDGPPALYPGPRKCAMGG